MCYTKTANHFFILCMKKTLIRHILVHLNERLSILLSAANNAHLAAIDEQSIAETQYDTLAIEASYLAEGQSKRVTDIKKAIKDFEQLLDSLNQVESSSTTRVKLGSIIQLAQDKKMRNYFFIAPSAAGYRCTIEENNFTVITPQSPIGKALLNKTIKDEILIALPKTQRIDEIIAIK